VELGGIAARPIGNVPLELEGRCKRFTTVAPPLENEGAMATYLVACFKGAGRPETDDYPRVDAKNELAAASEACSEPLVDSGKPVDLRAVVHFSPTKGAPKSFLRRPSSGSG